jgi:hypothetical protein
MNRQQTAVEFLIEMTSKLGYISADIAEQAKEMEKQQIIDACDYGIKIYINDPITSEDYYNETFNK